MGIVISSIKAIFSSTCGALKCTCGILGCFLCVDSPGKGGISNTVAKVITLLLFTVTTIACFFLRYYGDDASFNFVEGQLIDICGNVTGVQVFCEGDAAVYRVTSGLGVYFALMIFSCLFGTKFHRGCWLWKIIIWAGLCIGFLFIPGGSFDELTFIWFAQISSIVALLAQAFLLVAFAHDWNCKGEKYARRDAASLVCIESVILLAVLALYSISIVGFVLVLNFYLCTFGRITTIITIGLVLLYSAISLFRKKLTGTKGSILVSGTITTYVVFLDWAATEINADTTCSPFGNNEVAAGGAIVGIAIFFLLVSLSWSVNIGPHKIRSIVFGEDNPSTILSQAPRHNSTSSNSRSGQQGNRFERIHIATFYFIMGVSGLYMAMTITDWGLNTYAVNELSPSWILIGSQWVIIAVYLLMLVAPAFKKRKPTQTTEEPDILALHGIRTTGQSELASP